MLPQLTTYGGLGFLPPMNLPHDLSMVSGMAAGTQEERHDSYGGLAAAPGFLSLPYDALHEGECVICLPSPTVTRHAEAAVPWARITALHQCLPT